MSDPLLPAHSPSPSTHATTENEKSLLNRLNDWCLPLPKLLYFNISCVVYTLYVFRYKFIGSEYLHLTNSDFGNISAIMAITGALGTTLFSWIADRLSSHRLILLFLCVGILASLEIFPWYIVKLKNDIIRFWWSATFLSVYALLVGGTLPLVDFFVLLILQKKYNDTSLYGRQCLFGTISYGVTSWVAGVLLEKYGMSGIFHLQRFSILIAVITIFYLPSNSSTCSVTKIKSISSKGTNGEGNISTVRSKWTDLLRTRFIFMLIVVFLIGYSRSVMSTFISKYWDETLNLTPEQAGTASYFGVIMEFVIFIVGPQVLRLFGEHWMFLIAQLAMALRIWIYVIAGEKLKYRSPSVNGIELLKGVGFGMTQIAGTKVTGDSAPKGLEATSLAMYSACYTQLPAIFAAYIGGLCYRLGGGSHSLFLLTAYIVTAGVVLYVLRGVLTGTLRRRQPNQ